MKLSMMCPVAARCEIQVYFIVTQVCIPAHLKPLYVDDLFYLLRTMSFMRESHMELKMMEHTIKMIYKEGVC